MAPFALHSPVKRRLHTASEPTMPIPGVKMRAADAHHEVKPQAGGGTRVRGPLGAGRAPPSLRSKRAGSPNAASVVTASGRVRIMSAPQAPRAHSGRVDDRAGGVSTSARYASRAPPQVARKNATSMPLHSVQSSAPTPRKSGGSRYDEARLAEVVLSSAEPGEQRSALRAASRTPIPRRRSRPRA